MKKITMILLIAFSFGVANDSDGETLYKKCSACHGLKAEKKALGKSQIIQGWEVDKIKNALIGYKDGTYGAAMKGIMKGQVGSLSDGDIEALATYINALK